MEHSCDIAVVGSGFAGSLIAMIARRLGYSVVLLERGRHPRVVIGESSTPLSNLLLERLAIEYELPAITPLSKWGSWQRSYPHMACGLKRGFTFCHHRLGRVDKRDTEHGNMLLVAASPHDEIADTHWYRADLDSWFVDQARSLGVEYVDQAKLEEFADHGRCAVLKGEREGREIAFRAKFVVDASGPRGFLHRALQLSEVALPNYPQTQALYSHFAGVQRPQVTHSGLDGAQPYPPEDAAVHHLFDGGWIWVLRFNNGITSAGVAATAAASMKLKLSNGRPAWERLVASIPTLRAQFATAQATQPFRFIPRLSFLSSRTYGDKWVMLPSAAGFFDPLLSTGFPLTLLGIGRVAELLRQGLESPHFSASLRDYAMDTEQELLATSRLIGSLYANMHDFPVFKSLGLLYFAAAIYSETARRLGKPRRAGSFLLNDHPSFGPACREIHERALLGRRAAESARLTEDIQRAIEPIDLAGLSDSTRKWYPVDADELLRSASKVGATRKEILSMLEKSGFYLQDA